VSTETTVDEWGIASPRAVNPLVSSAREFNFSLTSPLFVFVCACMYEKILGGFSILVFL
jgi:hypothetical protein